MPLVGAGSFPALEGALRDWLRSHPVVGPLVGATGSPLKGGHVFLGLPTGGVATTSPYIAIHRVGGGPPSGVDYPMDAARMQVDVWDAKNQKIRCLGVARVVAATLLDLTCGTLLSNEVRALGASGITMPYAPDPSTGEPRYSINVLIQAQAI